MNIRLIDVFVLGPFQLYISTLLKTPLLKIFSLYIGISTILFNGHNYLCLDSPKAICIINTPTIGKYQIHRLYNLFIMYPIMYIISQQPEIPKHFRILQWINIIIGFLYNLYYYAKYTKDYGLY